MCWGQNWPCRDCLVSRRVNPNNFFLISLKLNKGGKNCCNEILKTC